MQAWRLLDTAPRPAVENMALDEVILTAGKRLFRLPTAGHPGPVGLSSSFVESCCTLTTRGV